MSSTRQLEIPHSVDNHGSEETFRPTRAAVKKFGQIALEHQRQLVKDAALRCARNGGWIFVQKNPSYRNSHKARSLKASLQATCASPFCPSFDHPFVAGEYRVSIEPPDNALLKYIPTKPLADLATTCVSPISGEENLRGKGEHNCLWMHVACAECLGIGQFSHIDRIRTERRSGILPGLDYGLDSPEIYAVLKWIAVAKGNEKRDKNPAGDEGRDYWCKDDGLAVYESRQEFDYAGRWKRVHVQVAANEVKDRLLSTVLTYTGVLKGRVEKLEADTIGTASLPRVPNTIEQRVVKGSQARQGARKPGEERRKEELDKAYEADLEDNAPSSAAHACSRLTGTTSKQIGKRIIRWHVNRPKQNGWDDYLTKMRDAAQRAIEPETDSAAASSSESPPMEATASESEESSTGSLRLETPMVRFLVSGSENTSSPSLDSPVNELPSEAEDISSDADESLDSWSDPDRTLATIGENIGLATRIF